MFLENHSTQNVFKYRLSFNSELFETKLWPLGGRQKQTGERKKNFNSFVRRALKTFRCGILLIQGKWISYVGNCNTISPVEEICNNVPGEDSLLCWRYWVDLRHLGKSKAQPNKDHPRGLEFLNDVIIGVFWDVLSMLVDCCLVLDLRIWTQSSPYCSSCSQKVCAAAGSVPRCNGWR